MEISSGFNIADIFSKINQTIAESGDKLSAAMNSIGDNKISDQDMLKLQFQVNMYNTLLETASTISKSLTDEAKQLAQRAS